MALFAVPRDPSTALHSAQDDSGNGWREFASSSVDVTKLRAGEERAAEAGPRRLGGVGIAHAGGAALALGPAGGEAGEEVRRCGALIRIRRTGKDEPVGVGDALLQVRAEAAIGP